MTRGYGQLQKNIYGFFSFFAKLPLPMSTMNCDSKIINDTYDFNYLIILVTHGTEF